MRWPIVLILSWQVTLMVLELLFCANNGNYSADGSSQWYSRILLYSNRTTWFFRIIPDWNCFSVIPDPVLEGETSRYACWCFQIVLEHGLESHRFVTKRSDVKNWHWCCIRCFHLRRAGSAGDARCIGQAPKLSQYLFVVVSFTGGLDCVWLLPNIVIRVKREEERYEWWTSRKL